SLHHRRGAGRGGSARRTAVGAAPSFADGLAAIAPSGDDHPGSRASMTTRTPPTHPIAIAHRAGNSLDELRRAHATGGDLIEADVWMYHGRLEVRHLKTIGPLPVLWDRWELARGWTPRMNLASLLAALDPGAELMLDLKGTSRHLSDAVL